MSFVVDGATYERRKKLTFDTAPHLSGDLSNQTSVVKFTSSDSDFWDNSPPVAGGGVRFADNAGTTLYDFEVEDYDTTSDEAIWHVKFTHLSASNSIIYIYYDVDSETDGSSQADTWDSDYVRGYHLNEDAPGGAFDDFKGVTNLTNTGTVSVATRIGKGRSADGVDDDLAFATGDISTAIHTAPGVTIEMTIDLGSVNDTPQDLFSVELGDSSTGINMRILATTDTLRVGGRSREADGFQSKTTSETFSAGTIYHIVAILDFANSKIYIYRDGVVLIDGEAVTFGSATYSNQGNQTKIDRLCSSFIAGLLSDVDIDEVTISKVVRSADWVKAHYQSGLRDWLTIGAVEPPNDVIVTPPTQTSIFSIPAHTVIVTSNVTVAVATQAATFSIPAPTIIVTSNVVVIAGVQVAVFSIPSVLVVIIIPNPFAPRIVRRTTIPKIQHKK